MGENNKQIEEYLKQLSQNAMSVYYVKLIKALQSSRENNDSHNET